MLFRNWLNINWLWHDKNLSISIHTRSNTKYSFKIGIECSIRFKFDNLSKKLIIKWITWWDWSHSYKSSFYIYIFTCLFKIESHIRLLFAMCAKYNNVCGRTSSDEHLYIEFKWINKCVGIYPFVNSSEIQVFHLIHNTHTIFAMPFIIRCVCVCVSFKKCYF